MTWYWRLSLVAKTMLLVLFATIVVGIYWYTSRSVVEQVSQLSAREVKTHQALDLLIDAEHAALMAHSSLRGYALSHEERFKLEYDQAVTRFNARTDELSRLLAHDSTLHTPLLEAEALWLGWLHSFAGPLITDVEANRPLESTRIHRSSDLMAQVHERLEQVHAKERYSGTTADPKPLMQRYYRYVVILNLTAIGLVALFFYAFATRLAREVHSLIRGAEAVAQGDLGFQVAPVTTPELDRLVSHFNAMSRSLLGQSEELRAQHEELLAQNEMLIQGQSELTSVKAEVENERDNMASLNQLVAKSQSSRSLSELCEQILEWLLDRARADVGAIMIREGGGLGYIAAQVGLTEAATRTEKVQGLMAEAIRKNRVVTAGYPTGGLSRPVFTTEVPVTQEAYLPISYAGTALAVAMVGSTRAHGFPSYRGSMLRITADTIGAVMANRLSYDRLSEAYEQLRVRKQEITVLNESVARERDEAAQRRDLLQAVLNATGEGIFVGLNDGDQVFFNKHFFSMLELPTPEESITVTAVEAMMAPTLAKLAIGETLDRLRANPFAVHSERLIGIGDARRSYDWTTAPVLDASGQMLGRVFILRDITQEVESERLKEEFISTVSHELRTPLTSIRGYLELLLDGDLGPVPPQQQEVHAVMNQNAAQLLSLINDLLEVEKLAGGHIPLVFGPVDVAEILHRVIRMGEQTARAKGLTVEEEIDDGLPLVRGDEGRLVQAFTNLLANAIKYTKQGRVTIRAREGEGWIRVSFQDTGIGIAPEHRGRLFERFFRVDNAYTREVGGVGLGLPITKELVERHGGRLEVESEPGQGSTFTVLLPVLVPEGGDQNGQDCTGGG